MLFLCCFLIHFGHRDPLYASVNELNWTGYAEHSKIADGRLEACVSGLQTNKTFRDRYHNAAKHWCGQTAPKPGKASAISDATDSLTNAPTGWLTNPLSWPGLQREREREKGGVKCLIKGGWLRLWRWSWSCHMTVIIRTRTSCRGWNCILIHNTLLSQRRAGQLSDALNSPES